MMGTTTDQLEKQIKELVSQGYEVRFQPYRMRVDSLAPHDRGTKKVNAVRVVVVVYNEQPDDKLRASRGQRIDNNSTSMVEWAMDTAYQRIRESAPFVPREEKPQ